MKLPKEAKGQRFDHAIQRALKDQGRHVSVREVRRGLKERKIRVNDRVRAAGDRAAGEERITLEGFVPRAEAELVAEPNLMATAPVIFSDDRLLVLNKPSGLATAPLVPGELHTLVGAAVAYAPEIATAGPPLEGGLLHRLDAATSGVVLFAKDRKTRALLRADFRAHRIEKTYLAVVRDELTLGPANEDSTRVLQGAIASGPTPDRVRVVSSGGLSAETRIRVLERLGPLLALVEATTWMGRRHQVRAHLASAGAPIVRDPIYGDGERDELFPRLALHAHRVRLSKDPRFDRSSFVAELPSDLLQAIERVRG